MAIDPFPNPIFPVRRDIDHAAPTVEAQPQVEGAVPARRIVFTAAGRLPAAAAHLDEVASPKPRLMEQLAKLRIERALLNGKGRTWGHRHLRRICFLLVYYFY